MLWSPQHPSQHSRQIEHLENTEKKAQERIGKESKCGRDAGEAGRKGGREEGRQREAEEAREVGEGQAGNNKEGRKEERKEGINKE